MKKMFYYSIILMIYTFSLSPLEAQPEVTFSLQEVISEKGEEEFISVNLQLVSQYDDQLLYQQSRDMEDREKRRRFVVDELKQFSEHNQADLLSYLEEMEAAGNVKEIRPLWIVNLVNCKAKPEIIRELMAHTDIARIDYNKVRNVLMTGTQDKSKAIMEPDNLKTRNLAWNVTLVNADKVWNEGYTGEGVIVAVLDTGINYNHVDITDNMWEHPDYPNHGFNFVDNNHNTMDYQGHGTHCAGTVAGTGAAGTGTGMAPDATIMNLKVLNDSGGGTEAGVWAGIEFAVEYGADIMSLSLGWQHQWGPNRSMWRTTMNNALSAGVIASVAAGNEGGWGGQPPPNEVRTPGDVPPPWLHPDQTLIGGTSAVVCVGSTTQNDIISGFSSKGPVTWQNVSPFNDYPYNPGMGLIRPDVVAPGSNILSLVHYNNTGYTTKSGTSMAAPAVAGVMALMISTSPSINPEMISQVLEETAIDVGQTGGKSNTYGSGRIDAMEAILGLADPEAPATITNLNIIPGEQGELHANISWTNPDETVAGNPLTELDYIYVYRNEDLIETIENPEIGGEETYHDNDITQAGLYTYKIIGENAAGEGLPTNKEVWIGEDVPAAPDNILLEADGYDGVITWDAPTEGKHGGHFTGENLTYTLVRFPCNEEVAANIPETSFIDGNIPGIDTYYYTVTSYNEVGEGGTGESNEATLGPPYSLPFEEDFTGVPTGEIPEGWELETPVPGAWGANNSSLAGGAPPEMRLYFSPSATSTHYLKTPPINTSVAETLTFEFRHFLSHFSGPYTLKVISIVGGQEYLIDQWVNPTGFGATPEEYILTAEDHGVGCTHFQIAFVFDGDNWNINNWNKDDIFLDVDIPAEYYTVTFNIEEEGGDPVPKAVVTLGNVTNPPGDYVFEDVLVGDYEYTIEKQGFFTEEGTVYVDDDITVDVLMLRSYKVVFDITDEEGNEITDAVVTFDGKTNDPGDYVFEEIAEGNYEYMVEKEGYVTVEDEVYVDDNITVNVIMPLATYTVTFNVMDEAGEPLADATATLNGETNPPGDYVFEDVEPGTYDYIVEKTGYITVEGQVTVEDEDVTEDVTMVKEFYTLTLVANPEEGGNVDGDGEYPAGEEVVISAEANPFWKFVNWTGDTQYVDDPESATAKVTMPAEDISLTANFEELPPPPVYNLTLIANPAEGGTVHGEGKYGEGDEVSITATPNEGWKFINWTGDIAYVDDPASAKTTVTMPAENITLTANFEKEAETYTLSLNANPPEGGRAEGAGQYEKGEEVAITAIPNEEWYFTGWTGDTEFVDNPYSTTATVTMPDKNITLTANFEKDTTPPVYTLTLNIEPRDTGTVEGEGEYEEGEEAAINATPEPGWMFVNWTGDTEYIDNPGSAATLVTMPAMDITLTANFEEIPPGHYTLTLMANPVEGGTIDGGGVYPEGKDVTITATPYYDADWKFENWTGDIDYVDDPESETAIVTMPDKDITLTANFLYISVEDITDIEVSVYPNPARDKFYVESSEMIKQIRLIDINGQVVKNIAVDALSTGINVNNFRAGVYFMQIHTGESLITKRVQVVR